MLSVLNITGVTALNETAVDSIEARIGGSLKE